jgi:SSS family solute:Na+ symporter
MRSSLHAVDWAIVAVFLAFIAGTTLYCRQFVRTVADFLVAGRVAGRYLLTVSQGLGGAISIIAGWEMLYAAGLPTQWWTLLSLPVAMILALTGFIAYRFRQTRALTLAQFFEMRYSRRFRFFAGLLGWISGIFNYGIFPAVTARFLIYFLDLPTDFEIGSLAVPTFPVVMALYLGFALFTALAGGQVSIMMTDFFQGVVTLVLFVVLLFYFAQRFAWSDIVAGLQTSPVGHSMLNPYQTGQVSDFNVGYFLIGIFSQIYNARSWQGTSGFNAAARTPHEAQMAGILGQWRSFVQQMCLLFIPLVAFAVLNLPKFSSVAAPIQADIATIHDPTIREQMIVPLFLNHVLPAGLLGLFAAVLIASAISCDNTYLHSWGSIFIQDVILPLRKKPISARTHLLLLRLSIVGVAVFGFVFSLLFPLKEYILMYFAITGAIYLGGAGAVIIGGLYWNRGTTTAAWVALISGSVLAFGGLLLEQFWPFMVRSFPGNAWMAAHAARFPIDGQILYFIAMLVASLLYIVVSLCGPRREYDMDRLFHRGAYALPEDELAGSTTKHFSWPELLGLTAEFTRGDRIFFWVTVGWSVGWWVLFFAGTGFHFLRGSTDTEWSAFWWIKIWLSSVLGTGLTVWLIRGGLRDASDLFRDLRRARAEEKDDGRVDPAETKRIAHPPPPSS